MEQQTLRGDPEYSSWKKLKWTFPCLTSNQNFQNLWHNGEHPQTAVNIDFSQSNSCIQQFSVLVRQPCNGQGTNNSVQNRVLYPEFYNLQKLKLERDIVRYWCSQHMLDHTSDKVCVVNSQSGIGQGFLVPSLEQGWKIKLIMGQHRVIVSVCQLHTPIQDQQSTPRHNCQVDDKK